MQNSKKLILRRTTSIDSILEQVNIASTQGAEGEGVPYDPERLVSIFHKWPIDTVRSACLEGLKPSFRVLKHLDWARQTIESFIAISNNSAALEVLEAYIDEVYREARRLQDDNRWSRDDAPDYLARHYPSVWTEFVRMIRFVVHLGGREDFFRPALKIVCSCVNPETFPKCYYHSELQCTQVLFATALDKLTKPYEEEHWHCAHRVLVMIAKTGDHVHMERLSTIITAHESGATCRGEYVSDRLCQTSNLAVVREVLCILKEAKQQVKKVTRMAA